MCTCSIADYSLLGFKVSSVDQLIPIPVTGVWSSRIEKRNGDDYITQVDDNCVALKAYKEL